MKIQWKIFACFLLVFLLSLSLFGLTASASSVTIPSFPLSGAEASIMAQTSYPSYYQQIMDMPYRFFIYTNFSTYNDGGHSTIIAVGSTQSFKFSQGYIWKAKNQQVSVQHFEFSYFKGNASYNVGRSYDRVRSISWVDGSTLESNGYQRLDIEWVALNANIIAYNPDFANYPYYAYNAISSIWEILPESTDVFFYEFPIDNEPTLQLPGLSIGGKLDGSTFVYDDGSIIVEKSGEYGIGWENGLGGTLKNIIRCFNAPVSAAEPITVRFWEHDYTVLEPSFFESSVWGVARVVIIASMSITVIIFLKNMIMKLISAQGNGDGE